MVVSNSWFTYILKAFSWDYRTTRCCQIPDECAVEHFLFSHQLQHAFLYGDHWLQHRKAFIKCWFRCVLPLIYFRLNLFGVWNVVNNISVTTYTAQRRTCFLPVKGGGGQATTYIISLFQFLWQEMKICCGLVIIVKKFSSIPSEVQIQLVWSVLAVHLWHVVTYRVLIALITHSCSYSRHNTAQLAQHSKALQSRAAKAALMIYISPRL